MTRRYYAPDLPAAGGEVVLSPTEAQHACRVMRVEIGDSVVLFDGQGNEANARIQSVSRSECICVTEPAQAVDRELPCSLHLAIALPKPDRARNLVERLTELGVATLTPLIAARTQRKPSQSLIDKLQRTVIESCKQCERNQLMEIKAVSNSKDFFASSISGKRLVAHPGATTDSHHSLSESQELIVAIGPEGGFSDDEIEIAGDSGFAFLGLGKRIYRVETAATVIASIVSMESAR